MLLGKSRENKVRLWDWEEGQVGLGAGAAAPEAAGTYRDQGLNDLVPGALTVGFGLHEAGEPIALIGFQHMECERHHESRQHYHGSRLLPADSAQKEAHNCDGDVG